MDTTSRRTVVLVQLPIPPLGPEPIRGNVPLAAAYLKVWAESKGLAPHYDIQILPGRDANTLGDHALVAALVAREPWMVGFTCYVWNIERTLWIAAELKRLRPGVRIVLGGPEITPDNAWVLDTLDYDFAVIGEGEQTSGMICVRRTLSAADTPGSSARASRRSPHCSTPCEIRPNRHAGRCPSRAGRAWTVSPVCTFRRLRDRGTTPPVAPRSAPQCRT
jgi:hypothetical protein